MQEKTKVIRFILEWHDSSKETFFEDPKINVFLEVGNVSLDGWQGEIVVDLGIE